MNTPTQLPDFNKVVERLRKPAKTLIIQPDGPDGDSVSTIIGLGLALEKIGHKVTMSTIEEIPRSLRFLPFIGRFRTQPPLKEHDLVIGVDMGEFNRTAYFEDLKQQPSAPDSKHFRFTINIDHHPSEDFGDLNLIDPVAPATTEMVYHILKALKIEIDHDIATALLTGLVTDTGCFQHANTSSRAYRLAGECVRAGARMPKIMRHTFHNKNLNQLKLWGGDGLRSSAIE
ncbi:bifunctional oligoribonuclease/PAP phosphatase NrnA, partial [Patescibacteria group bacterium]